MTPNIVQLEYAASQSFATRNARRAFKYLLILAILSGLCVGASFLALTENILAGILHAIVFTITIVVAVYGGVALMSFQGASTRGGYGARFVLDLLALAGLAIIGVAPLVYPLVRTGSGNVKTMALLALGSAYVLLAGTTVRHLMLYRVLAGACREIGRAGMARQLVALGWCKVIYEGLWLGCCAAALVLVGVNVLTANSGSLDDVVIYFAVASAYGAMGFGAIWVWMIVAHAQLFVLARKS